MCRKAANHLPVNNHQSGKTWLIYICHFQRPSLPLCRLHPALHLRRYFPSHHAAEYQRKTNTGIDAKTFTALSCSSGYPQQQQQQQQLQNAGNHVTRNCRGLPLYDDPLYAKVRHQTPLIGNCFRTSSDCGRHQDQMPEFNGTDASFVGGRPTAATTASSGGVYAIAPAGVTSPYISTCADQRQSIAVAMTTCFQSGCGSFIF